MSSRPTAGQASVEYVAALALLAAVFAVAAPAVGAPDIPRAVVGKLRLALCLVASDVCSNRAAREAGLAPCPLRSDTTGHEATVGAAIYEAGGKTTLTVTPRSDGSVSVVRTAGVHVGVGVGVGGDLSLGPLVFDIGTTGALRERVEAARAWVFPDQATAARFLEHRNRNAINEREFPAAWHSVDDTRELSLMVGAAVGAKGFDDRGDLAGIAGSGGHVLGGRVTREGMVTVYGRAQMDGPDITFPFLPAIGPGHEEFVVEFSFSRDGPREIAIRHAVPSGMGGQVEETVGRLDLRDPANLAFARSLIDARLPWPPHLHKQARALGRRIATHGVVERTVMTVEDGSRGASASLRLGVKVGASYRHIKVRRELVSATARTGGAERERFDCVA